MSPFRHFFDTMGFMTRLGPTRLLPEESMARSMAYLPVVGLALGLVLTLPFWAGLFEGSAWTQAWAMVAASAFLTRGLHLDGLSDVLDAATAHTEPEKFWVVIKDSRSGAFGVMGLTLALGGQIVLLHEILSAGDFGVAVWSFVLGRATCVILGSRVRDLTRPGLGKLYIDGATDKVAFWAVGFTAVSGIALAGIGTTLAGVVLASVAVLGLYRLAFRVGGVNGDFLGAAVVLGELCAGLGYALTL